MSIQNFPDCLLAPDHAFPDVWVYDYRMDKEVIKSKVQLNQHVFSFLQNGHKQVHFAHTSAAVNELQSILIRNGNCLVTELLNEEAVYFCKLFFFSSKCLEDFLLKFNINPAHHRLPAQETPFFIIETDTYLSLFVHSLSALMTLKPAQEKAWLLVKFEEIMLYLWQKYGDAFLNYICSLVEKDDKLSFRKKVETHVLSNLKLEEIAFLCNMSLSSFKRHFVSEFNEPPGKWFQRKRLHKARELLQNGQLKPSEIYLELGYHNLSNFSAAFKNEFGVSPARFVQDVRPLELEIADN
jgi:AraC-like DNA-binding protein